ncbi:MAG: hypothetical protein PHR54_08860 [Anaerolineaceae bacterium]|jgi:nucleoside 2-deoxyribosyltransferase|nr:hypothetical protein [Anaerolineaceae bacterium]
MSSKNCPICNDETAHVTDCQGLSGFFCACQNCRRYEIDDSLYFGIKNTVIIGEKLRSSIYYYLTQIRKNHTEENHRTVRFIPDSIDNKEISVQGSRIVVSYEAVTNFYPKDIDEQISMILVNFMNRCERPGDSIFGGNFASEMPHLFFLKDWKENEKMVEIDFWLETLIALGYVQKKTPYYLLTIEGWNRARNYAKEQATSKTAFIAMHFDDELKSAREEIIQAIKSAGFFPVIIDMKEHNNQIVPEILYEIRNSRFVVADFTNQRGGVYYEAGYAEGLKIPVIALCRKDDFANVHFDLKQKNIILWKIPQEISERLEKRIKATLDVH